MGASIAFLHPADLGGVLTELVEAGRGLIHPVVREYPDMWQYAARVRSAGIDVTAIEMSANKAKSADLRREETLKPPLTPAG